MSILIELSLLFSSLLPRPLANGWTEDDLEPPPLLNTSLLSQNTPLTRVRPKIHAADLGQHPLTV